MGGGSGGGNGHGGCVGVLLQESRRAEGCCVFLFVFFFLFRCFYFSVLSFQLFMSIMGGGSAMNPHCLDAASEGFVEADVCGDITLVLQWSLLCCRYVRRLLFLGCRFAYLSEAFSIDPVCCP